MPIFVNRENHVDLAGTFQELGDVRELTHGIRANCLCRFDMPKGYCNLWSWNAGLERRPPNPARDGPTPLSWTSLASHRTTFLSNARLIRTRRLFALRLPH